MAAFIVKPLLYCYILILSHACLPTGGSAPHRTFTPCITANALSLTGSRNDKLISTPNMLTSPHVGHHPMNYLSVAEGSNLHPIHVSTSNIEYNKQDGKLEVICTLFTDDFEDALAKQYHAKTDLTKQEMHAAMDELVKKYVAANLDIQADDRNVKLNYLGYEINREATDVYLESDALPPVKKVDVTVSLLYSLFDDQMNIVHVIVGGVRKSERVNYPDKKIEQVF